MGPDAAATSTSAPCWRMATTPCRDSSPATSRAMSIRPRHASPPAARAASLGQTVASGRRCLNRARMVAASRSRRPSGVGSHHGSPRSPNATLASCTRGRADCGSLRTSRRAVISSSTNSWRSVSGMAGSVVRHRRPDTIRYRPSAVVVPSSAGSMGPLFLQGPAGAASHRVEAKWARPRPDPRKKGSEDGRPVLRPLYLPTMTPPGARHRPTRLNLGVAPRWRAPRPLPGRIYIVATPSGDVCRWDRPAATAAFPR